MGYYIYDKWNLIDAEKLFWIATIVSLNFGVHSLVHFWEEVWFDFNPMVDDKSTVHDLPVR